MMKKSAAQIVLHIFLYLIPGTLFTTTAAYGVQEKELDIRREVSDIRKEYRVRVHYRYDEDFYFPAGSRLDRLDSSATELSEAEIRRTLPIVRVFLSNFPERVLRRHLGDIYLMQDLRMGGGVWGGTYYKNRIYVNCRSGDRHILSTLYHEISSMLMKGYRFPMFDWQKVNGSDARYIGVRQFADGKNRGWASSKPGLEKGFLTNYASSNLENDFNEISEWLFTRYWRLRRLGKEYPRIGEKVELAIEFYKSIDKDFEFSDKAKI